MIKQSERLLFGPSKSTFGEQLNLDHLREERQERLRTVMKKHDMSVCLLTGPLGAGYVTGKWSMPFPQLDYVLFSVEHAPLVWDIPGNYHHLRDVEPWSLKPGSWRCSHVWQGLGGGVGAAEEHSKLFAAEIADVMSEMGLKGEQLGLFGGFDLFAMKALQAEGIEVIDATLVVNEARMIKTKSEILCWKMAAAIADAAWFAVYERMRPGMTARDLDAIVCEVAIKAGADIPVMSGFFTGPWSFQRGIVATDRLIEIGDMVHGDIMGVAFLGYRTCYYRTFIVGRKPNAKELDWYKQVVDKQNAILEDMKPGATTADVARHMTPASEWGYPAEYEGYSLDICHGIGLTQHEPPVATRTWSFDHPQVFEPGMTMAVETIAGEHLVGGVRIEDMVLITEDGVEMVSRFPRDELIAIKPIG